MNDPGGPLARAPRGGNVPFRKRRRKRVRSRGDAARAEPYQTRLSPVARRDVRRGYGSGRGRNSAHSLRLITGSLVLRHLAVDARPALSGRPCRGARPRDRVFRRIRGAGGTATTRGGVAPGAAARDVVLPLRAHGGSLRAPRHACRPARSPRRPWRAAPWPAPSVRASRSDRVFAGVPRPAPHLGHRRGRHAGTVERRCGAARADVVGGRTPPRPTAARVLQVARLPMAWDHPCDRCGH